MPLLYQSECTHQLKICAGTAAGFLLFGRIRLHHLKIKTNVGKDLSRWEVLPWMSVKNTMQCGENKSMHC